MNGTFGDLLDLPSFESADWGLQALRGCPPSPPDSTPYESNYLFFILLSFSDGCTYLM